VRIQPRSVRLLVAAAVTCAAGLTAALSPAGAATPGPKAVSGGSVEAWQTIHYRPQPPDRTPTVAYYFTGGGNDDVSRVSGTPTAGFGRTKPAGSNDSMQTTSPAVRTGSQGSAVWVAPYSGRIQGRITFSWWWATLDAASGLGGANATVRVIADPGGKAEKIIGSNGIAISAFGSEPQQLTSVVDVKGTVAKSLRIEVTPTYVDASEDLRVYYGSAAHPSAFTIPVRPTPPVKLPSTKRVKDTDPLVLAATYIGRKAAEPTIGVTKQGNAFMVAADFHAADEDLRDVRRRQDVERHHAEHRRAELPADDPRSLPVRRPEDGPHLQRRPDRRLLRAAVVGRPGQDLEPRQPVRLRDAGG
jgi:hypothetical protein